MAKGKLFLLLVVLVVVFAGLVLLKGIMDSDGDWLSSLFSGGDNNSGGWGFDLGDFGGLLGGGLNLGGGGKTIISTNNNTELGSVAGYIQWVKDDELIFSGASEYGNSIWAIKTNGSNLRDLTKNTGDFRQEFTKKWDFSFGYKGGASPEYNESTGKVVYYAFEKQEIGDNYHYLETVDFSGENIEVFAIIEGADPSQGFQISPNGKYMYVAGGHLTELKEGTKYYGPEKVFDGWGAKFTKDSKTIMYRNDNGFYSYNIANDKSEFLADLDCYYSDYCEKDNTVICTISTEAICSPFVLYDLKTGTKKKDLGCDFNPSSLAFSADCSKVAYRSYNHTEGEMVKLLNVS